MTKPLPPGVHVAAPEVAVPADSLRLLVDLTTADAFGQPVVQQQIFDETLQVIANARRWVVLDQFLFTDLRADNLDSLAYHLALGFTVVGVARRHARVGGRDVDVLFIERFLREG